MSTATNAPVHTEAKWCRPTAYRATVAHSPRWPKLVVLRSSCGHALGVGYVWRHQGFVAWKRCAR